MTPGRILSLVFAMTALPCLLSTDAWAQRPTQFDTRHYLYDYELPPGEVGQRKILARQSMVGYFQPVRLHGPAGSQIDVFSEGMFQATTEKTTTAGMMVGHVYRLKVTNIPGHPGKELYPSVEVIGRLFPPEGQELKFPIPVNLHMDDLEPAMNGALVTRVIYLENPRTAIAEQRGPHDQPFFDVGVNEDPLRVAETMGRPMAILRIGSRIPDNEELNAFGFGTPPMIWYDSASVRQFKTPGDMDPSNIRKIMPGFEKDEETRFRQDTSVRQVAYLEPQEGILHPAPAPANETKTAPLPSDQGWSLGDTPTPGSSRRTRFPGTTTGNMVVPAIPAATVQEDCQVSQTPPAYGQAMFKNAAPMFRLPPWPDELLIDGGDRSLQALVKDTGDRWEVHGLESEDTIAHFDTLDGRRIVDASNRVAIYAPRFAAVRKIDYLGRTRYANQIGHMGDEVAAHSSRQSDFSTTTKQNLQPLRHERMLQPTGIENRTRGVRIENGVNIKALGSTYRSFEDLRLMRTGYLDNREKGRLSIAIQRALSWESDVSAQSTTHNLRVTVASDVKEAQEAVHVKTEFGRPQLRLVKIASADNALPGDYVDFTIRFDNVGTQTIGNVTILDNLTGRLAYVADSSECSLPGKLIVEPNKSGSDVLRWEITDPIKPGKGGIIRFRCRVR